MRERGGEVGDEVGDLLDLGDPPERDAAGASRSASSCGSFMSRAIASTSPAQRSVRTGPGFTATKLMLNRPYWPASALVRFCPAALHAPGTISQYDSFTPSLPMRFTTRPLPCRLHDRQRRLEAADIAHELELEPLHPRRLVEDLEDAARRGAGIVHQDVDAAEIAGGAADEALGVLPRA